MGISDDVIGDVIGRVIGVIKCKVDQVPLITFTSNEPSELSQWLCHDDSTINIVVLIIIIIITLAH